MKVKPLHIVIVLVVSTVLFTVGFFLHPYILNIYIPHHNHVNYTIIQTGTPQKLALNFGFALMTLPVFSYAGWLITKLNITKQKQTFAGVQLIILMVVLVYFAVDLRRQLSEYTDIGEFIAVNATLDLGNFKLSNVVFYGTIGGFIIAVLLSPIIKKIK